MLDLWNAVSTNRVLERIARHLPPSTWIVGGCVRDLLLGREVFDIDLVTFSDVWVLSKKIETLLNGKAFWIDRERLVARVAVKGTPLTVDVLPPRGQDIEEDLSKRDITINAMACDPKTGMTIDPLHGRDDLARRVIRLIAEENLADDPLRGLRCLRFAVQLGFAVEDRTMSLISAHADLIHQVSPERIKQEILKALSCPRGSVFFQLMVESGYAEELFHPDPEMEHLLSAERAFGMDVLLEKAHDVITGAGEYLGREVEQGFTRAAALRMAAFFSGITRDRDRITGICRGLAFSSKTTRTIAGILEAQERLADLEGKKDLCFLFRAFPDCIPDMLMLACAMDDGQRSRISEIWDFYRSTYLPLRKTPLLSGKEIMDILKLPPGPAVGRYLDAVEDARCEGLISSGEEAREYLQSIHRNGRW
jgi:tRNA nucleotidyltransferase/poly(A) polymerase